MLQRASEFIQTAKEDLQAISAIVKGVWGLSDRSARQEIPIENSRHLTTAETVNIITEELPLYSEAFYLINKLNPTPAGGTFSIRANNVRFKDTNGNNHTIFESLISNESQGFRLLYVLEDRQFERVLTFNGIEADAINSYKVDQILPQARRPFGISLRIVIQDMFHQIRNGGLNIESFFSTDKDNLLQNQISEATSVMDGIIEHFIDVSSMKEEGDTRSIPEILLSDPVMVEQIKNFKLMDTIEG